MAGRFQTTEHPQYRLAFNHPPPFHMLPKDNLGLLRSSYARGRFKWCPCLWMKEQLQCVVGKFCRIPTLAKGIPQSAKQILFRARKIAFTWLWIPNEGQRYTVRSARRQRMVVNYDCCHLCQWLSGKPGRHIDLVRRDEIWSGILDTTTWRYGISVGALRNDGIYFKNTHDIMFLTLWWMLFR